MVGGKISLMVACSWRWGGNRSLFGAVAGFFGGKCELFIMKCTDLQMATLLFCGRHGIRRPGPGVLKTALAWGCAISRGLPLMLRRPDGQGEGVQ